MTKQITPHKVYVVEHPNGYSVQDRQDGVGTLFGSFDLSSKNEAARLAKRLNFLARVKQETYSPVDIVTGSEPQAVKFDLSNPVHSIIAKTAAVLSLPLKCPIHECIMEQNSNNLFYCPAIDCSQHYEASQDRWFTL